MGLQAEAQLETGSKAAKKGASEASTVAESRQLELPRCVGYIDTTQ